MCRVAKKSRGVRFADLLGSTLHHCTCSLTTQIPSQAVACQIVQSIARKSAGIARPALPCDHKLPRRGARLKCKTNEFCTKNVGPLSSVQNDPHYQQTT
jgi:hypothetical protein